MECEKHPGEDILMICSTCEGEVLCTKCAIQGEHRSHDVKDIKKLGENIKTRLENLVVKEESQESELGKHLKYINRTLSDNQEISDKVCALIDKRGEFLKNKIDKISDALKLKCRLNLQENEQTFKNRQECIQTCISDCTRVLDSGDPAEQVKTLRRTQGILKQPNDSLETKTVSFEEGLLHDHDLENIFGNVYVSKRDGGLDSSDVLTSGNSVAEECVASNEQGEDAVYEENGSDIYRRKSTVISTSTCNSFQQSVSTGVSLMCPHVKNKDKCWVKCKQESEIKLVSEMGETEMTIKFDMRIRGMDMTSDGTLYVASYQKKSVYKVSGIGCNVKNTKAFGTANLMPYHICVDLEDKLLVTLLDEDTYELKKKSRRLLARYDISGKMLTHVEHDDRGERLFVVPDKVHVNKCNGDVIVINRISRESRHLVVLDSRLKLKFRHLSEGAVLPKELVYTAPNPKEDRDSSKFIAADVCTDSSGNILMAVPHRKSVYLLNNHFIYENTVDRSDDNPWSLAFQDGDKLWIGYKSGRISIITY